MSSGEAPIASGRPLVARVSPVAATAAAARTAADEATAAVTAAVEDTAVRVVAAGSFGVTGPVFLALQRSIRRMRSDLSA